MSSSQSCGLNPAARSDHEGTSQPRTPSRLPATPLAEPRHGESTLLANPFFVLLCCGWFWCGVSVLCCLFLTCVVCVVFVLLLCVVLCCCCVAVCFVVVVCVCVWWVFRASPPDPPPPDPPPPDRPKFRSFFSLSRHSFHSFLPLLVLVEFWWCF